MNKTKNITIDPSQKDILKQAMESSENEKVDFLKSIVGGIGSQDNLEVMCDADRAYADSTYVKK